jgi:hypothetical protein
MPAVPPARVRPAAGRPRRASRRRRVALLTASLVVVVAGVVAVDLARSTRTASDGGGSALIASQAAVRAEAVSWITSQVGHDIAVACDAAMCSDLAQHGFPTASLNVLGQTAPDPYGSELVVATADLRSQFGSKLGSFYAPTVVATFGAGQTRIDVRVIAADGAAAYDRQLARDLQTRKTSGAQVARNKNIALTRAARAQLLSGAVDIRLVTTLAFLAGQEPVSVVAFSSFAPGAAPGVPMRWAYLAESDPAAHQSGAAYVRSLIAFARDLRPPYVPLALTTARLPDGQTVLRIAFPAPSPLGLLP